MSNLQKIPITCNHVNKQYIHHIKMEIPEKVTRIIRKPEKPGFYIGFSILCVEKKKMFQIFTKTCARNGFLFLVVVIFF